MTATPRYKSKTLAALLSFLVGTLGAHRFYLYGARDLFGWLYLAGTALGLAGIRLLLDTDRASVTGWCLAAPGLVSLMAAFLTAIVYGLRPDDKWNARFNAASAQQSRSGWGVVFIVMLALFIGTSLLMGALAETLRTYFEATTAPG